MLAGTRPQGFTECKTMQETSEMSWDTWKLRVLSILHTSILGFPAYCPRDYSRVGDIWCLFPRWSLSGTFSWSIIPHACPLEHKRRLTCSSEPRSTRNIFRDIANQSVHGWRCEACSQFSARRLLFRARLTNIWSTRAFVFFAIFGSLILRTAAKNRVRFFAKPYSNIRDAEQAWISRRSPKYRRCKQNMSKSGIYGEFRQRILDPRAKCWTFDIPLIGIRPEVSFTEEGGYPPCGNTKGEFR